MKQQLNSQLSTLSLATDNSVHARPHLGWLLLPGQTCLGVMGTGRLISTRGPPLVAISSYSLERQPPGHSWHPVLPRNMNIPLLDGSDFALRMCNLE